MPAPLLPQAWKQVAARVRSASGVALFFDFDGTLAPVVADPLEARLDHVTRGALARLAGHPRSRVCIISGRRRDDLRARVALPGLRYLGVHGADAGNAISGPPDFAPEALGRVSEARQVLLASLQGAKGVRIEDKTLSFALHYRGACPDVIARTGRLLEEIVARFGGHLHAIPGDCVWEILPSENRGKGQAVWKQWRTWGRERLPVYIGNDGTDEGAFQTLARGITVRVGPSRPSRARYSLRNPAEVRWFLVQLEKEMQWKKPPDSNS